MRRVEQQRVLRHRAAVVRGARPCLRFRQVLHLAHRAAQRQVPLVGVIAGEGRHADETQDDEAGHDLHNAISREEKRLGKK
jgi:hypothetical protein